MAIPTKFIVEELGVALAQRLHPTVTVWNRLEGRPRRDDFSRALKAEVRDATWMLARQWQIGEFTADDAGSPLFAKVAVRTSPLVNYRAGDAAPEPLEASLPLEATVERRPIPWAWNGQAMHLDLRAQVGRHWKKLLAARALAYAPQYLAQYAFVLPVRDASTDVIYAHRRGWQQLAALAGRAIDGGALLAYLAADPTHHASDGIGAGVDSPALDTLGDELRAWFGALYTQPASDTAWRPDYLEYQFACAGPQAGGEVVLEADEYAQGHVDWYSFDHAASGATLGPSPVGARTESVTVRPFIPTPLAFEGMPDPRWWALEDRKTDFGAVTPATTDLAQLLLMEFGLVYANDWFLVPFRLPLGSLARVEGLAVTNTFGERFWIGAAGSGAEDNWHRWGMFQLANPSARSADNSLLVPPAVTRTQDGDALEEIELARDEVANMVWAIERVIPSVLGEGRSGKDEARETLAYHQGLLDATAPAPLAYAAPIAYLAMTTVPEHWIPFVPVHVPDDVREIQLQRSRMLRILAGAPPVPSPRPVPPRTTVMREGLEASPRQPYFLHEEEVPRAGILVTQSFRRTRWVDGSAPTWLGITRETGRGERPSGLAFDAIVPGAPRT